MINKIIQVPSIIWILVFFWMEKCNVCMAKFSEESNRLLYLLVIMRTVIGQLAGCIPLYDRPTKS